MTATRITPGLADVPTEVDMVVIGLVFMVFEAFGDDQPHQAEAHADADADGTVRR